MEVYGEIDVHKYKTHITLPFTVCHYFLTLPAQGLFRVKDYGLGDAWQGKSRTHTHTCIYSHTLTHPHNLKYTLLPLAFWPLGGELRTNLSVCHSADMTNQICCCCPRRVVTQLLNLPITSPLTSFPMHPTYSKVNHSSLLLPAFTLQAMLRLVLP